MFEKPCSRPARCALGIALALCVWGIASPAVAARKTAMESMSTPRPHNAEAGVSLDAITRCVIAAAEVNEWRPTFEKPGVVLAEKVTQEGKHRATVKISYDTESFIIKYVTSYNLGYTEKHCRSHTFGNPNIRKRTPCYGPAIHPNYNAWLRILANSIADHAALLAAGDAGPKIRYSLPGADTNSEPRDRIAPALVADEIRKLKGLADDGILSQQEYEDRKKLLLAR